MKKTTMGTPKLMLSRVTVRNLGESARSTRAATETTGQDTGGSDSCNNCPEIDRRP